MNKSRTTASERAKIFEEFKQWYQENKENNLQLQNLMKNATHSDTFSLEGEDWLFDFSKQHIDKTAFEKLQEIVEKLKIREEIQNMFEGKTVNKTEDRAVLHTALRSPPDTVIEVDGQNIIPEVHSELDRIFEYTKRVRSGEIVGVTGKRIDTILSIGIGGSYLGVLSAYLAFKNTKTGFKNSRDYTARFLADPDPQDFHTQIEGLDPESTLVIILSKSFTTAETMLNAQTAREWILRSLQCIDGSLSESEIISHHFAAVSTNLEKTSEFGIPDNRVFTFWDWVGGRFSVSSAIGMVSLSLIFGQSTVQQFLKGMNNIDENFKNETDISKNISLLMGLIGFYNRTIEGYSNKAILPYNQGLSTFFNHIQQVSMESNGKRVDQNGDILNYETGYVVFGESGTKGQHSFFQLLHQGEVVPCEFIGYAKNPFDYTLDGEKITNHEELLTNFLAQPVALALGREPPTDCTNELKSHRTFPGNRPSLSLIFKEFTPYSIGQLFAIYEHRTAVEGFIWGINSFDQYGVELGKVLAKGYKKNIENGSLWNGEAENLKEEGIYNIAKFIGKFRN